MLITAFKHLTCSRYIKILLLILGILNNHLYAKIELPTNTKAGDLIFRKGTETVSIAVLALDNSGFSHVGMLIGDKNNWQVIHATPSEVKGRKDGVVIDDLDFFLDTKRSEQFAIYQIQANEQTRMQAIDIIQKQQHKSFSMKDDNFGTYCTALIWRAYLNAGFNLQVNFTHLNIPFMSGDYLLLEELIASKHLKMLTD